MNSLTIQQGNISESVPSIVIDKLYRLALTSKVEDPNNALEMSLSGNISPVSAYEDAVIYLRSKFPNLTINTPSSGFYIRFADNAIEQLCISNFSSDGVGLSTGDAQSVSKIPDNFAKNNTSVVSFDELRYFGNITIGGYAFNGCTNLTSIDLSNVTNIDGSAFNGCSNLQIKLNIPNLISLGGRAFYGSGITEIENLGYITRIVNHAGIGVFTNCTKLTKVQLPTTIQYIDGAAFAGCNNLTYISGLENVISLGSQPFAGTGSFDFVLNFRNLTTAGTACLSNGNGTSTLRRKQVYFPKLMASSNGSHWSNYWSHGGTFQNMNSDLIYFRDIQAFHPYDFCYTSCTALVINNTTPPSWNNNNDRSDADQQALQNYQNGWRENMLGQSTIGTIYVPDSAVNTYKQDSNWSTVQDKIQPLSQLTKVATEEDLQDGQIALIEEYM